MNKRLLLRLLCGLILVVSFCSILSNDVWADCGGAPTSLINCNDDQNGIGHILKIVMDVFFVGVGVLATLGITIFGVQYMNSRDNEEKMRKAKRRIVEIVIGVIAYVLLYVGLTWLIPGGVPDPETWEAYEMPDIPTAPVYPEPPETPENPEKPVTPEPENPTNPIPSGPTPTVGGDYECKDGNGNVSADNCKQEIGFSVSDYPLGKLTVRFPMLAVSGMEAMSWNNWRGHHGYIHTYNKAAMEAGNYKYWKDTSVSIYDLCSNYEGTLKDGDLCYDNRVEGNNDGIYNGAAVTRSADPGNVDLVSSMGIDESFYTNIKYIIGPQAPYYSLLDYDSYAGYKYPMVRLAGTPVVSAFNTSGGGSVTITNVNNNYLNKDHCRTVTMQVDNGNGLKTSMIYVHLSTVDYNGSPATNGRSVGDGSIIGFTGTSDCAQNTTPHLHMSLSKSYYERYDLWNLFNNVSMTAGDSRYQYRELVNYHFQVLCKKSSDSSVCRRELDDDYNNIGNGNKINKSAKSWEFGEGVKRIE